MRWWMMGAVAGALALMAMAGAQAQPDRQALVTRGAALVNGIAGCGNCHTEKGPTGADLPGRNLAGGQVLEEPGLFRAVAANITPDRETGIGRWTDAQIGRAIREGLRPDGTLVGPPMPIEQYRHISDADLAAMVAYLRTVTPVRNQVAKSSYSMPLPPAYGPPITSVPPPADTAVARGAYLAGPLGHCVECHTPMGPRGRDWSRTGAGGPPIHGPWGQAVPRNITPAALSGWTDAQIVRAVTQGISADGHRLGPPMGFSYYARMSQAELRDLLAYLRSLPAKE